MKTKLTLTLEVGKVVYFVKYIVYLKCLTTDHANKPLLSLYALSELDSANTNTFSLLNAVFLFPN